VKCPHCRAEINHLNFCETKSHNAEVDLIYGKLVHSNEGVDVEVRSYNCPECEEPICGDDQRAIEFLEGG